MAGKVTKREMPSRNGDTAEQRSVMPTEATPADVMPTEAIPTDATPQKIATVEGMTEYTLPNGLRIVLCPDVSRPTVTVNLTVFVGSRHEGYGEAGLAHLLEHMVFKGTPDHQDIMGLLKERGAQFNGTTWLDRTNYYETLSATDDNLEFAIRLEADRLINSCIDADDLASEMRVVRNEFEGTENNVQRVLMQKMMAAAFQWHNYGKTTIGNRADIERVPVSRLKSFYRRFYQPDNAMLIVGGKFDADRTLALAAKYFGTIPRPQRELDQTYTEEPAQDGERLVTLRRVGEVPVAGLLYHIPAGSHPDFPAVDVLTTMLTSQPSGRLYESLVRTRQAATVFGTSFALHDPGVLLLLGKAATGNGAQDLLTGMIDGVESAATFTEHEVERARQQLLRQRDQTIRNTTGLAIELSDWAAQGDWRLFFLYRDRLEKVTAEDVNRVARQYLTRNNRTAGLFEPTDNAERIAVPPTPSLDDMIGDYQGREQIAQGEEFDPDPQAIEYRVQRTALPNGQFQTTVLPKKTLGENVILRLSVRYGNLEQLHGQALAAEALPAMMLRGTAHLSRQDIKELFDKHRAQVGLTGVPGRVTVSVQTQRDNLAPVLDVVRQILREPCFPEDELELLKQAMLASAEQRLTDPQAQASNAVSEQLSPFEPDDPRYVTTLAEDVARVSTLTSANIRALYETCLRGDIGEVTIVGDVDLESTQPVIGAMLQDWTSDVPYARLPSVHHANEWGSLVRINTPDKGQASYMAGMTLPVRDDHPDYAALTMGNYILGGGLDSRLGRRVRQQEGLSYGIGSSLQASPLDERGVFAIQAICAPEKLDHLHHVIREELDRLLQDGISAEELQTQSQGLLKQRNLRRTSDRALVAQLATQAFVGRTMEFTRDFERQIQALTMDDVQSAMQRQIAPDRLYVAMAGDLTPASDGPSP